MQWLCVQMFVIGTLKAQCSSKSKMHCLFLRKYLDESAKGWACAQMHRHRRVHYNVHDQLHSQRDALTEAIHEYGSDMNQNEPFQ